MAEYEIPQELRGLDYKPFISWCTLHDVELPKQAFERKLLPLVDYSGLEKADSNLVRLAAREVYDVLSHLPHMMVERSTLGKIRWVTPLWFKRESTREKLKTTPDLQKALAPTAFAIAYTDRSYWETQSDEYRKNNPPVQDLYITALTPSIVEPRVAKVIQAQAILHEAVHTVSDQMIFQPDYKIKLPSEQEGARGGRIISGREALEEFARLTEGSEPITEYSKFYRDASGRYPTEEKLRYDAISEELAETVSFHILNNAFSRSPNGWSEKLLARPGLERFIRKFMSARKV
ncbi:Uncharacterised protein [uncultured archaeon]|nr:Uncharacterised protein [uncultured archaeon]